MNMDKGLGNVFSLGGIVCLVAIAKDVSDRALDSEGEYLRGRGEEEKVFIPMKNSARP